MQIFRHWRGLPPEARGATVALGNFDGVHLGHVALLRAALCQCVFENELCISDSDAVADRCDRTAARAPGNKRIRWCATSCGDVTSSGEMRRVTSRRCEDDALE